MSTEHEASEHGGASAPPDETAPIGAARAAHEPGGAGGAAQAGSAPGAGTGDDAGVATEAGAEQPGDDALASVTRIIEAALLVAGRPLAMGDLEKLFGGQGEAPARNTLRQALARLDAEWSDGCLELQEVATGYRAQVRNEYEPWIARLWDEKPPRYSRALLETLAIIAYRQPMTRSEIEEIRGVTVSSQIIRTLTEREWIRVVGHRETPGRPAMYGTTREFLDYFNLKTLDQLPPISDIRDLEGNYPELGFEAEPAGSAGDAGGDGKAPAPVPGQGVEGGPDLEPAASEPAVDANHGMRMPRDAGAGEEGAREGGAGEPNADGSEPGDDDAASAGDEEDPSCTPVS